MKEVSLRSDSKSAVTNYTEHVVFCLYEPFALICRETYLWGGTSDMASNIQGSYNSFQKYFPKISLSFPGNFPYFSDLNSALSKHYLGY